MSAGRNPVMVERQRRCRSFSNHCIIESNLRLLFVSFLYGLCVCICVKLPRIISVSVRPFQFGLLHTNRAVLSPGAFKNAEQHGNNFIRAENGFYKVRRRVRYGFLYRSDPCDVRSTLALTRHLNRLHAYDEENNYRLLKELALDKDKHFDKSLGTKCSLYRYFNITYENVNDHLRSTMDEHFATQQAKAARSLYVVDGNAFNGDYTNWRLPIPRSMASYEFDGLNPNADKPVSDYAEDIKPQFSDPLLSSIYDLMSEPDAPRYVDPTEAMIELYDEVGDNEYYETTSGKVVKKDYLKDVDIVTSAETKRNREMLHTALSQPTEFPSYLDPTNPAHRTGRGRELQRRKDCGRLQRLRWNMDIDPADDILRGHRETGNAITKEFLDSIEWEQPMPTYHDRNFYKRTFAEGGFGEADRTSDSYFDIQFIGSPDTYPFAISAGMQYTWPIYWVPLLTKKHPKRYGQPLRSPVFNLGGIEPLQLWFYPEGSASSTDGFCSLKLVAPPGCEYNRTVVGPMYRESKDYISRSLNFCRLVDKSDKEFLRMRENDKDYVILGPAGNVYVGVGVVDEPLRTAPGSHRFAYDWDEGDYDLHQWLKKQTADPDDAFQQDNVDRERTHSVWYESHKYKYVPDRHLSRYWKRRYINEMNWRQPTF